jgi:hypothetical protein
LRSLVSSVSLCCFSAVSLCCFSAVNLCDYCLLSLQSIFAITAFTVFFQLLVSLIFFLLFFLLLPSNCCSHGSVSLSSSCCSYSLSSCQLLTVLRMLYAIRSSSCRRFHLLFVPPSVNPFGSINPSVVSTSDHSDHSISIACCNPSSVGVSVVSKASSLSLEFIHCLNCWISAITAVGLWLLLCLLFNHCRRVFAITALLLLLGSCFTGLCDHGLCLLPSVPSSRPLSSSVGAFLKALFRCFYFMRSHCFSSHWGRPGSCSQTNCRLQTVAIEKFRSVESVLAFTN